MRVIDRRPQVSRRLFLRGAVTAVPAAMISAEAAWAQDVKTLQPRTVATLVRMARDIYPHDHVPDLYYVNAIKPYDGKAASDAGLRDLLEGGVTRLDDDARNRHQRAYLDVPGEEERVALLTSIEQTPFFNKVRSDLVVSLYNQPDLWRRFGYEGESYEKGGYISRGFDDIDWLAKA